MKKTWYQLPEKDCKDLRKYEFNAVRWGLAALNSIAYGKEDLKNRLDCIPNGRVRWRLMEGQLRSLLNDILGTTPTKQCRSIRNEMEDMKLQLIPKTMVGRERVVCDIKDLSFIVFHAQKDMCTGCLGTPEDYEKCKLYQTLMTVCPPDGEWDEQTCPYWKDDWWDK